MKPGTAALLLTVLFASLAAAQAEAPSAAFRRANEQAAKSRWDDAISEYRQLAKDGVKAPSLYWNWAQAASASGRRGEALWAFLNGRELTPGDASMIREVERVRGDLGLDPSEVSLGALGDLRMLARRFHFDLLAIVAFLFSAISAILKRPSVAFSRAGFLVGALLVTPFLLGAGREARGVVVPKDAPLVDAPRPDAVALASLREGEVVPILETQGEYVKIQDASGARGFAHKDDVRRIGDE